MGSAQKSHTNAWCCADFCNVQGYLGTFETAVSVYYVMYDFGSSILFWLTLIALVVILPLHVLCLCQSWYTVKCNFSFAFNYDVSLIAIKEKLTVQMTCHVIYLIPALFADGLVSLWTAAALLSTCLAVEISQGEFIPRHWWLLQAQPANFRWGRYVCSWTWTCRSPCCCFSSGCDIYVSARRTNSPCSCEEPEALCFGAC